MNYFLTFFIVLNSCIAAFSQDPNAPYIMPDSTHSAPKIENRVMIPSTNLSINLFEEAFVDPYSPRITTEHFQSTFVQFYGDTIGYIMRNFTTANFERAGYKVIRNNEVYIDQYNGRRIDYKIPGKDMVVSQLYFGNSSFYVSATTGIIDTSNAMIDKVREMYFSIRVLKQAPEKARVFGFTYDTNLNFALQNDKQVSSTFRYNFNNQPSTEKNVSNVIVTQIPINGTTTIEDARDYIAKVLSSYLDKTAEIKEAIVDKSYSDGNALIYEFTIICIEDGKEVKNYVRVYTSDILDLLVWGRGYNPAEQLEIEKFIASIQFK